MIAVFDERMFEVWSAIIFCMVVYLAVGLLVASVFGHDTLPVASLNWSELDWAKLTKFG